MKISGRFVTITDNKFVPDRLVIYEGEAITFKLALSNETMTDTQVYQVNLVCTKFFDILDKVLSIILSGY